MKTMQRIETWQEQKTEFKNSSILPSYDRKKFALVSFKINIEKSSLENNQNFEKKLEKLYLEYVFFELQGGSVFDLSHIPRMAIITE